MAAAIKPPLFHGKADEDADAFIKTLDRYITYKEITDATKKVNLFAVLLKDSAGDGDWYESLADDRKDTDTHLRAAFAARYQTPDSLKFKCANEIFTRKQALDESVDDYIMHMRKLAKSISADDSILRFAVINA